MHTHSRSRRQRGSKGDDDQLLVSRADEPRSESYSHPHHTESYRVPATSRGSYDMDREASSSRNHRDVDSWRIVDDTTQRDRYKYSSDPYLRSSRDDYDVLEPREADTWAGRPANDSHYAPPGSAWPQSQSHSQSQRYKSSYPTSSFPDSSSWTTSASYQDRSASYDSWPVEDNRNHLHDDRNLNVLSERPLEQDWPREGRRSSSDQKWQSDSGWDTRRSETRDNSWVDPLPRNNVLPEKSLPVDDRSWEPAPTWQPSSRSEPQGQRNPSGRNNHGNKNNKGKKGHQQSKGKRDWRSDDALNNWPRRDTYSSANKNQKSSAKRKLPRSSSRSRSRSPAESYYSRRSSRGRSRTRSPSPGSKRRRRSPVPRHSRSPVDRGRGGWSSRRDPNYSSPISHRSFDSRRHRHHSLSSASSTSRSSRSRSRSPIDRPRPVHRLPPSTVKDIPITLPLAVGKGSRRNGKSQANGKYGNRGAAANRTGNVSRTPLSYTSSMDAMPPPTSVPSYHAAPSRDIAASPESSFFNSAVSELAVEPPASQGPRLVRSAGFKPIGRPSSEVKKFFPSVEDENELDLPTQLKLPAASHSHDTPRGLPTPAPDSSGVSSGWNGEHQPRESDVESGRFSQQRSEGNLGRSHIKRPPIDLPHHLPIAMDSEPPRDLKSVDQIHSGAPTPTSRTILSDRDANETEILPTPNTATRGDLYVIISQVGEGTFGKVYKARNSITQLHVALKRIRMESERDGFPVTAMREIKLLQSLRHENIVRLYEMMVSNGSVYMVFEYMDHDLTGILSQTQFSFTDAHLKSLCHQMLAGLAYLHHKGVIHRDIKGSNILINNRGELKLGDFGLARFYQKRRRTDYTNRVITLWYRPPELLFGATIYGPEVDMWSAGCIMLELFTKKPVFQGNDEIHQLDVIYRIIGTPTPERWSGVLSLPWYELVKPKEVVPNHFRVLFEKWMSNAALDLAERLLAYNPSQRATAIQAMDAPYFTQEDPPAAMPVGLATLEGEWHELETKRERAKKRRKTETVIQ